MPETRTLLTYIDAEDAEVLVFYARCNGREIEMCVFDQSTSIQKRISPLEALHLSAELMKYALELLHKER